jgi:glutamate-ammonia-ligase adenylyltransferase
MEIHKDTETTLEGLNYNKQAVSLRVAVALLGGSLPAVDAQRVLSDLAERLIQAVLQLSRLDMQARHGHLANAQLCIVAYGSLGARTLGFDSDLDLIFLYRPGDEVSDGQRPLPAERYHTATVRRLLSLLSAITPSGRLFTTDARLRPNGRAGLLLSDIDAFRQYQQQQAWVWELQALTRARPVAGETEVAEDFASARLEALHKRRDTDKLAAEIRRMRARIQEQNPNGDALKYGAGGLLDIEFVTQLGLLTMAAAGTELLGSTEIAKQLQALSSCGWLQADTARRLARAYADLNQAKLTAVLDDAGVADVDGLLAAARPVCDRVLRAEAAAPS